MSRTKLDAVNSCLRGIGAQAVSSLEDPNLDAALAEQTIDAVMTDIQARGWWFNREPNWKLTPDAAGEIKVPNNVIDLVSVGDSRPEEITIRSGKLYDVQNHTFQMAGVLDCEGNLNCTFLVFLDFEDMPIVARRAVTYVSRRLFAQDLEVDPTRWNFQARDEQNAIVALDRADAKQRRHNYTNNPAVASFLGRVGGPNARGGTVYRYQGSRGERS